MADERVERGRHDLINGRRALRLGFPGEGRRYFQAALLRFRSPELRLGEAHALRGLAEAALTCGELSAAEAHARKALAVYASLPQLVDAFESAAAAASPTLDAVRQGAVEGEVAAWSLLGEILGRRDDPRGAHEALAAAEQRASDLPDAVGQAGILLANGRVAQHEGRHDDAIAAFQQAVEAHRGGDHQDGELIAHMLLAEAHVSRGDVEPAYDALHAALTLARDLEQPALQARVLCALGEVALGARHDAEAESYFQDALPNAREAGDVEREGQALVGLGTAAGRQGSPDAIQHLYQGIAVLARSQRRPGLASALLRLGNHARRVAAPRLALAASEIARRIYVRTEPVVGQGQALRTQVKALAQLRKGRATLMAAVARERLAGSVQPNAVDVAAWYAERAPADLMDEVRSMELVDLMDGVREAVEHILEPDLEAIGLQAHELGSIPVAIGLVEVLAQDVDEPGPSRLSVRPAPPARSRPPTEVPLDDDTDEVERAEEPTEITDAGGYRSLDDVYGSLFET